MLELHPGISTSGAAEPSKLCLRDLAGQWHVRGETHALQSELHRLLHYGDLSSLRDHVRVLVASRLNKKSVHHDAPGGRNPRAAKVGHHSVVEDPLFGASARENEEKLYREATLTDSLTFGHDVQSANEDVKGQLKLQRP